jgi:DNA repair protein RecO (recombination protein O)
MSGTYKATGINLKAVPIGENDRLLTILTREYGLIKAIFPGARKAKSSLGGRSTLFMANELLIAKGRSIDKVTQAETIGNFSGLMGDLSKLASGQYLAELALAQALKERPQEELYQLLILHLGRLNTIEHHDTTATISHLCQGIFHLIALDGVAPQVYDCYLSKRSIEPNFEINNWQTGFSIEAGSTVDLVASDEDPSATINFRLSALELLCFQHLSDPSLERLERTLDNFSLETIADTEIAIVWRRLERILRQYIQYHLNLNIRSASLIDVE